MKIGNNKGFTLVELLVVVAIIGLLAVAVIVAINPAAKISATKTAQAKRDTKVAAEAIERCITSYLIANPTATEATAIDNCDTAALLGITVGTGQTLNSSATSGCFSSQTGVATVWIKYTHSSTGATSYVEDATTACTGGV